MDTGPFKTPEGNEAIALFVKNELLPLIKKIQELTIDSAKINNSNLNIFYNSDLKIIMQKYQSESEKFIKAYHKWSTPDILFEKTDLKNKHPDHIVKALQDYKDWDEAIMLYINKGFRLLEYASKNIYQSEVAINNIRILVISLMALGVAIFL
ncbi:MAG: hypothetical protein WCV58_02740 [Patescibacteria group bacterium]|jgi:hypothetical protein